MRAGQYSSDKGGRGCTKHDIYAFNPHYEWASHKTWVGVVCSWLSVAFIGFYIALTLRDYIVRPPELVSQGDIDLLQVPQEYPFRIPKLGLRLTYNNVSNLDGPSMALANENPYVRFHFRHIVMKNQERIKETDMILEPCVVSNRPSLCPVTNSSYILQGIYFKENYHFLEITVDKCVDDPTCAPLSEINSKIASGEFRILAQVSMEAQQFDVEQFHKTGTGFTIQNRSLDYYALPNIELKADIIMQARQIQKEQRYIGSPPLPESRIDVLSYFGRDIDLIPRLRREKNLMTFHIRLRENVLQEEVSYWCPSVLDLFGLWGAMASFVASLSIGFCAMQYNKWHFYKHFRNATREKRAEGQQEAFAAMQFVRAAHGKGDCDVSRRHRDYMYNNLQAQYDALMVEPDLRLFETHHFDSDGRMAMSAAELKFPTTPFGELRRLAIFEHGRKKRAAQFISLWYGRHLVKKGFITDPERKRQLFSTGSSYSAIYDASEHSASMNNDRSDRGTGGLLSSMRRRRKKRRRSNNSSREEPSTAAEEDEARMDAMEKGFHSDAGPLSPLTAPSQTTAPSHTTTTAASTEAPFPIVRMESRRRQPHQIEIPFFHNFIYDQA